MDEFENPPGTTPLDFEEMQGLKLHHITTREELNRFEQDNINAALQWLESRRKSDILNEKFVRTLHQKMFGKVWKWAGAFRKSGKNIGVDWYNIPSELHTLLLDTRFWIENKTFPMDEIAARFHHRLVAIHLFANGNGRHARLMTDILLKEIFKEPPFTWNIKGMPVEEVRNQYLAALRQADYHNYSALLDFVKAGWKNTDTN